jgi:uncharacterized protein
MEYESGAYIGRVSPTPHLLVVARDDHLMVADEALAAYNLALEPKKLVLVPGGHFDAYVAGFAVASTAPCGAWLVKRLGGLVPCASHFPATSRRKASIACR